MTDPAGHTARTVGLACAAVYLGLSLLYAASLNGLSERTVWILLSATLEELIFRKWLIGFVRRNYSVWTAIAVSAFLFACIHLNLIHFFAFFAMGVLLAVIYVLCKSIWPGVMLHAADNLLFVTLRSPGWSPIGFDSFELTATLALGYLGLAKLVLLAGLLVVLARRRLI